ncbi:MAG TPA: hypothetical protein PLS10_13675 [Chitinophagales bacterium]|nr:hypothetical protein [Chitinophagales bacterium]
MKTKAERMALRAKRKAKFKAIWKKITDWFRKLEDKVLPEIIDFSIKIMTAFKKVMDNGVVDILTDFIPGDADDVLVEKIRTVTGRVIDSLMISKECLAKETLEEKIKCFAEHLKTLPKHQQEGILIRMHADLIEQLNTEMNGSTLTKSEYAHLATGSYLAEKLNA